MDTSKTYIEMCDCPEIQELNEYLHGGYFVHKSTDKTKPFLIDDNRYIQTSPNRISRTIWLPRQEDLQEMVGDCNNPYPIIDGFAKYALNPKRLDSNEWIMLSMEQLWLAFVMKEKHGKIWSESQWVKEELNAENNGS